MATSAKRFGISDLDIETEEQLRRIELELERKQGANVAVELGSQRRARSPLPRVTGVTLDDSTIGSIAVVWDAVDININRYEVEISEDSSFADPVTFKVNEPQLVLPTTLDPEVTYFVRVRAVGTRVQQGFHDIGDWSGPLTIAPGQATFTNLQAGAAGNVITYEFGENAFDVLTLVAGSDDNDYQVFSVPAFDLPTAATCLVIISYQYHWELLEDLDVITITVYLDAQQIGQFTKQFGDASITKFDDWRDTIAIVPPPQALEAGVHRIKVKLDLTTTETGGSGSTLTTENMVVSVLEVRR